jgi:hypothetical protein
MTRVGYHEIWLVKSELPKERIFKKVLPNSGTCGRAKKRKIDGILRVMREDAEQSLEVSSETRDSRFSPRDVLHRT